MGTVTLPNTGECSPAYETKDVATFGVVAGLYALVGLVAGIQAIRALRAPLAPLDVNRTFFPPMWLALWLRSLFFFLIAFSEVGHCFTVNYDAEYPGLVILASLGDIIFCASYSIFIIFWVEIIFAATRRQATFLRVVRPVYLTIVLVTFLIEGCLWVLLLLPSCYEITSVVINAFAALIYLSTVIGFAVAGGKIFWMIRQSPPSRGRNAKLNEILILTSVCCIFLLMRAGLSLVFDTPAVTYVTGHILLRALFSTVTELLPAIAVLILLRKLPTKPDTGNVQAASSSYQILGSSH
ncbi:tobamovirus multiplication protein 1 [Pelomyxa schiedti]|nr:tobamovirus multiplication protein 1 [Pelomyxa schiedti]